MVILDEKSAVERQIILDKLLSMKSVPKVKSTIRTKTPIEQERVESKSKKDIVEEDNEIIDFELKTIEAPILHQNTKNWIIFSDLHVKR